MTLKTLKDINCEGCQWLQQAAKEWVKELEKGTHPKLTNFTVGMCEATANWITHFFNLEDDNGTD